MGGPRALGRRSRAETRELLLLAGALLADGTVVRRDDGVIASWLSHVRLEDVLPVAKQLQVYLAEHGDGTRPPARRGAYRWWVRDHRRAILATDVAAYHDIARSTAYTVFDDEGDFRAQLAGALLAAERVNDTSPMEARFAELVEEHGGAPPFETMLSELAAVELGRLRQLDPVHTEIGALPFAAHDHVRELLASTLREAADVEVEGSFAWWYDRLLLAYGWRLQAGLTCADLVVALYALTQGYLLTDRLGGAGTEDGGRDRSRAGFVEAVSGVVRRFAEPDPASGTHDTKRPDPRAP